MMGIAETKCSLCRDAVNGEDTEFFDGEFTICDACIRRITPKIIRLQADALHEQAELLNQIAEGAAK